MSTTERQAKKIATARETNRWISPHRQTNRYTQSDCLFFVRNIYMCMSPYSTLMHTAHTILFQAGTIVRICGQILPCIWGDNQTMHMVNRGKWQLALALMVIVQRMMTHVEMVNMSQRPKGKARNAKRSALLSSGRMHFLSSSAGNTFFNFFQ